MLRYLYHGSNNLFEKPEIYTDPKKWNHIEQRQGPGFYLALRKKHAESFGRYIYTIAVTRKI